MLTRWRLIEIQMLGWEDPDTKATELRLSDSRTGARELPLSPAAREILVRLSRTPGNPEVIPGSVPGMRLANLNAAWQVVRENAELEDVRMHDLRHAFALESGLLPTTGHELFVSHGQAHRDDQAWR